AAQNKTAQPSVTTIAIPQSAVHGSGVDQYVYLVEQGHVKQQGVKTLPASNNQVTVLSGLSGGEQLVVSAKTPLHDGEAVREQNP
ncbi:MAG: efflux RND transporter periplasmic adaptor subunit, partial [Gammaproteobacteria bacterium]